MKNARGQNKLFQIASLLMCFCNFATGYCTGLRPIYVIFFEFLPISFQMKNNDDIYEALIQKRLAKVSNFAEEKTDVTPSVRTCMAI